MGDTGELTGKVEKVEEKISNLQKEVTNLVGYMSGMPKEATAITIKEQPALAPVATAPAVVSGGPVVVVKCQQWQDFQSMAVGAQTISFSYKEEEKLFQADALRGNQLITYRGPLPDLSLVVKAFLSKELGVSERCILEGALAIS
ncbi:MAG: hypothetical protein ACQCN6_15135 [Candidatus Bathyarchaeia archaeon]|jgi:hypothetical protein